MARQLARRQRRERLAGVLIAVIGVAVLIVAIVALRNPKQVSSTAGSDTRVVTTTTSRSASKSSSPSKAHSSSKPASTSASRTASAIGSEPLIVLNDTRTANLARDAASRFEGGGWNVTTYDENYSNDIISTCAYFDPTVNGSKTAALALQKQYPTIKRVAARFPELPAGPIVVVLTTDYSPN